jgi:chromosome condensin MukBEF MukE localization factor
MKDIQAGQTWRYKKINRPNIVVDSINKYSEMIMVHHVGEERNKFELSWSVFLDNFELVDTNVEG